MGNEISLKEAIDKLINTYKWRGKLNEIQIRECWESVMGPIIAKRTDHLDLKEQVLYVKMNSQALRQELNYSKTMIRDKINEKLEQRAVKEVRFL